MIMTFLSADDNHLVVLLSSSASLDASPKKNWVENAGGLPPYVRKIARGIMKTGKSKSSSIAIAISRIKVWAGGGGGVDADTKAKAAAALAEWDAAKAKNKTSKVVKASHPSGEGEVLMLSNVGSFNTDIVRRAWNDRNEAARRKIREDAKAAGHDPYSDGAMSVPYSYVRELWTDYVIVEMDGIEGKSGQLLKVPYGVQGGTTVHFGEPTEVVVDYVEVDDDLSDFERGLLSDVLKLSALDRVSHLATKL
jgi:hypothetical protein